MEGGVFVLCEHEPASQENKMRTRMDGRSEQKKNRGEKKEKRRQEYMS